MKSTPWRLAIYTYALASLGACGRATYQFTAPAAYLPAEVVAPPPSAATLAEAPRPARNAPALLLARQPGRPAPPRTFQPKRLLVKRQTQAPLKPLAAKRTPRPPTNTAGSAAYFSGWGFFALIALAALFALLVTALIAVVGTLLVRLIVHLFNGKSRHQASATATPATAP